MYMLMKFLYFDVCLCFVLIFLIFYLFKCIDVVCDVWDMELIVRVGESYNRVYGV